MAVIYRTKQRKMILDFLKENSDLHITAESISHHFSKQDTHIGKATIYRYLNLLVENNIVRKYPLGDGTSACYQYIDNLSQCTTHYHLKCNGCGKLIHMECDDLDSFFCHLKDKHNFKADPVQTIVYGDCAECFKK